MKRLKNVLVFLFAPSTFKLGFVITLGASYCSYLYYNTTSEQRQNHALLKFISEAHQKSIDYRLRMRGERAGAGEVALITIDEKSLEAIGRWPWPRSRIAAMIEELRRYNATVIAFDAVFAEPEVNPAMRTLISIKDSPAISPQLRKVIDDELAAADSDSILAQTVAKYAPNLVLGAYFDNHPDHFYPYQEYCGNLIDMSSPEYKSLENEDRPVVMLDETSVKAPEALMAIAKDSLDQIENKLMIGVDISKQSTHDRLALRDKIETQKQEYCDHWLIDGQDTSLTQIRGPASQIDPSQFMYSVLENSLLRTGRWWMNVPGVAKATKHTGYFNAFLDSDGTIRFSNLIVRYGQQFMASLALKAVMIAKNLGAIVTLQVNPLDPTLKSIKELTLTNADTGDAVYTIPVDVQGRLAINYAGPRYSFPHMSVAELFNGKETAEITTRENHAVTTRTVKKSDFIKDKIFLFGATATGIYDLRVTPFEENFPGPEVHANIMDNLLRKDFLRSPTEEASYMVFGVAGIGLAFSALISSLGAVVGLLLTLFTLIVIYYIDYHFLFQHGMVVTIILPLFLVGLLYTGLTFYKYLTEERKKKELKGTFQKYVSPAVVDEILKNPDNLNLGGRKQRMTVMFSDVRGFTTISEKLDPTKLSDILNAYLTPMTRLVFDTRGTLDKYMGDAIMAFWGAPIDLADHAKRACQCALLMMDKLKEINKFFAENNLPNIDIGIGVNTGDMSVGNMGSDIVRSYTVMGDSVNLGSRLEGINKEYGTHIIISEFTFEEVRNDFVCREVDWVKVKGKLQPVRIFELIGETPKVDQKVKDRVDWFNRGFGCYHERKWDEAIGHFQKALELDSEDKTSRLYVRRCEDYKEEPPPAEWDGVYTMKTK